MVKESIFVLKWLHLPFYHFLLSHSEENVRVGVVNLHKYPFLPYKYTFFKKCDSEAMKDSQTKIFGK